MNTKNVGVTTAVILGFVSMSVFAAGEKETSYAELQRLADEIDAVKSTESQAVVDELLSEYQQLSLTLGGDQAPSINSAAAPVIVQSAPAAPANTVSSSASFGSAPGLAITDNTTVSDVLAVNMADTYIWDVDLNVNITHTFPADLDMTLTSPSGTVVTISTDNGGGNDDVFAGTLFDDSATSPVTDFTYTAGVTATPLQIEAALSAFIGEDPNGNWTLEIADDAGGDTGTLVDWSLDVTTLDAVPVDTMASFSASPGTAITDNSGFTEVQDVTGMDDFVCDVNLITNITHTFPSDLDMTLTSPAGTVVTISTDNGGSNDDAFNGTVWDDSAASPATDFTYTTGVPAPTLVVEGAMGAFIGENPNGTWSIDVFDDAGGDTGTLVSWGLDVTTCAGIPTVTLPVPNNNPLVLLMLSLMLLFGAFWGFRKYQN